jgi:uncharacterized protein
MSTYYNKTSRTTVRRKPRRGRYHQAEIEAIIDEGIFGHVGFVSHDGQPLVLPMLYARHRGHIYLHGSPLSRLLEELGTGVPMCLTISLLDGIVLARSAFHSSVNYRSVVVLGHGRSVHNEDEKREALRRIVDHVMPGRSDDARGPSAKELGKTEVVKLAIEEASAKVRAGGPIDDKLDYELPIWAGELPVGLAVGTPITDQRCSAPAPAYVNGFGRERLAAR